MGHTLLVLNVYYSQTALIQVDKMNSMIKNTVLIAILLASGNVLAEVNDGWIRVANSAIGETYLNRAFMHLVQGSTTKEVEYWSKDVATTDDPERMVAVGNYAMTNSVARCSDGKSKDVSSTNYRGEVAVRANLTSWMMDYSAPVPDSVLYRKVAIVCSVAFPELRKLYGLH
jgi:hypothetical protein